MDPITVLSRLSSRGLMGCKLWGEKVDRPEAGKGVFSGQRAILLFLNVNGDLDFVVSLLYA